MPCSGDCCKRFYLPYKPANFAVANFEPGTELAFIKDMLIHIEDYNENTADPHYKDRVFEHSKGAWYTCRHWNTETKLCGVYEKRPKMCQKFPYGKKCQYNDKCDVPGEAWEPEKERV